MEWNHNRQVDQTGHLASPHSARGLSNAGSPMPSGETGRVAALELVQQAADVMRMLRQNTPTLRAPFQNLAGLVADLTVIWKTCVIRFKNAFVHTDSWT